MHNVLRIMVRMSIRATIEVIWTQARASRQYLVENIILSARLQNHRPCRSSSSSRDVPQAARTSDGRGHLMKIKLPLYDLCLGTIYSGLFLYHHPVRIDLSVPHALLRCLAYIINRHEKTPFQELISTARHFQQTHLIQQ